MSPSDPSLDDVLAGHTQQLARLEAQISQGERAAEVEFALCGELLGLAVRLYAIVAEVQGGDVKLPALGLTPTDAVLVSAALLRDQEMTPFDLTLWFQRVDSHARKSNAYPHAA